MEFEYNRHGTTSLRGFFNVAFDCMEAPYLYPTWAKEDFVKAVETLVGFVLKICRFENKKQPTTFYVL